MPKKDNSERIKFVKATFKNRQYAADKLRMYAAMFEGARTPDDIETLLCELLFLSERTIKRDKQNKMT